MEDSGDTFDEERPVEIQSKWADALDAHSMTPRRVRASRESLQIDSRSMTREHITNAFMRMHNEKYRVVVDAKFVGRVRIETRSREESERLLSIFGFGITDKNAAFHVLPPIHLPAFGTVLFCIVILGLFVARPESLSVPYVLGCFAIGSLFTAILAMLKRKAIVGRDGITLSALWGKKFIPYGDITKANLFADKNNPRSRNQVIYSGVAIRLRDARRILFPTTRGSATDDEQLGLLERIETGLTAWRASQPIDDAMLERAERSTEDWLSALRSLGEAETTYRVAAVDREALFAIVEDPANQAVSRVAAAVAISGRLDDEARARLRKSAEAIADPKLRVAMENVANENEEDVRAALDELESEVK